MQPLHVDPENPSTSFAGLLAALTTARTRTTQRSVPASPSSHFLADNLEDDVATLTYERALQNHARYRSNEPVSTSAFPQASQAASEAPSQPGKESKAAPKLVTAQSLSSSIDRSLPHVKKTASVTLRMSPAEFSQLQQRATEANLSVSAYLRSCTFEAEALRAQVKQAIAELRDHPAGTQPSRPAGRGWLRMLRCKESRR